MNQNTKPITINNIVAHFTRVIVACLTMMWGVINVVHNFLSLRSTGIPDSSSWTITLGFVLVTGVFPILIGIWILIRSRPAK